MSASNKGKSKKKPIAVIVTLAIIAIVAIIGLFGLLDFDETPSSEPPENFVSYPTVSSTISSSRDGKAHSIDVDLVVEYDDDAHKSAPHDAVYEAMERVVAALDYERLKDRDSVEHIEDMVRKELRGIVGDDVEEVYVGNIVIDFPGAIEETQQTNIQTNQRLKGLFRNLKD